MTDTSAPDLLLDAEAQNGGTTPPTIPALQPDQTQTAPPDASVPQPAADASAPQQAATQLSPADVSRRIGLLAKKYPSMSKSAQALYSMANQAVPDDELLGNVGTAVAGASAAVQATILRDMSGSAAWNRWQSYSPEWQQAIVQAGGAAPQKPSRGGLLGAWDSLANEVNGSGDFTSGSPLREIGGLAKVAGGVLNVGEQAAASATHPLVKAFNDNVAKPLGIEGATNEIGRTVGDMFGAGLTDKYPAWLWRATAYDQNTGGAGGTSLLGGLFSPKAWEATAPGKPFYFNQTLTKARSLLGGNNMDLDRLAQETAENNGDLGAAMTATFGDKPTPQSQSAFNRAQTDPRFAAAVKVYQTGGASFGRSIAMSAGLKPGTPAFSDVSGAADGVMAWYLTPARGVGGVAKMSKAARSFAPGSVSDALAASRLSDTEQASLATKVPTTDRTYFPTLAAAGGTGLRAGRQRWAQSLADHVNDGNFAGWAAAQPRAAAAFDHFNTYAHQAPDVTVGAASANDVLDWMRSTSGLDTIARGELGSYLNGADASLPTLTRIGSARVTAKVAATPVSKLASQVEQLGEPLGPLDVVGTQSRFVGTKNLLGDFAYRTMKSATTPVAPKVVPLVGADAPGLFSRYVDQFQLPTAARDQLVNAFATSQGASARRDLIAEATRIGLYQMGWGATDAGRELVDSFANQYRTRYGLTDASLLPDGSGRSASLMPDIDNAMAVGVPDLRQLWTSARGANLLSTTQGMLTSPRLETMMHKYWAPAALARAGFVPRVVSEEWLTAISRLSAGEIREAYGADQIGRAAAKFDEGDIGTGGSLRVRLGRTLMGRTLGLSDTVAAQKKAASLGEAGVQMGYSRSLMARNAQVQRSLMKAMVDQQKLMDKYGHGNSPEVEAAQLQIESLKGEAQSIFEQMAGDPIVQSAEAKGLFRSRGGYVDPAGINPSMGAFDPDLGTLATVKMRGRWRTARNVPDVYDPAFVGGAADAYARAGVSPQARQVVEAMSRMAPDDIAENEIRHAFDGSRLVSDSDGRQMGRDDRLSELRRVFSDLDPTVKGWLAEYSKAVGSGDAVGEVRSGFNLARAAEKVGTGTEAAQFLDGIIGSGYRPVGYSKPDYPLPARTERFADSYLAAPSGPQAKALLDALGSFDPANVEWSPGRARMSDRALTALMAPPGKVLRDRTAALTEGRRAAVAHAHTPEFAPFLPHADHVNVTPHGPVVEPVAPGMRRLYYPATTPDWQASGSLRVGDITEAQLRADVARTVLSPDRTAATALDALDTPTHKAINGSLWATEDPARAYAVAQHVAADKGLVGHVDISEEEAAAQHLAGPKVAVAAGSPFAGSRYLHHLAAATEDEKKRLASVAPALAHDGYHLTAPQLARGLPVDPEDHVVAPDGSWSNGATLEEGIAGQGGRLASEMYDLFAPKGTFHHRIAADLLAQEPHSLRFTAGDLRGIPSQDLPESVPVEMEMPLSKKSTWQRMNQTYYDRIVGPAIDGVVRTPLYTLNYAKGLRAWRGMAEPHFLTPGLREWGEKTAKTLKVAPVDLREAMRERDDAAAFGQDRPGMEPDELTPKVSGEAQDILDRLDALHASSADPAHAEETTAAWAAMEDRIDDAAHQAAGARAVNDTIPFVNDHTARTNMSMWVRNLAPFYWAQESFLKRWSRALAYNPATLANLELGIHGLASMGVVHKDQYGNDVVTIPGTAALTKMLGDAAFPHQVPQGVPLTMEVKMLTPGFNRTAAPAFGPLVSFPFDAVTARHPELTAADQTVTGSTPSGANPFEQLVPSGWARDAFNAIVTSGDKAQWVSANMQAQQMLTAGGLNPGSAGTSAEIQTFTDRTQNWTRNILLFRAALAFASPASPTLTWGDNTVGGQKVAAVHAELDAYLQQYGLDGIAKFAAKYPDATPYTVFGTTTPGGGSPPATKAAFDVLTSDPAFFKKNPAAGAYLLPQAPGNFDSNAWAQQQADGLRTSKDFTAYATELATNTASNQYYGARTAYLQALAQAGTNSSDRKIVQSNWTRWSTNFLGARPLFDQELTTGTGHQKRMAALSQMRQITLDGTAPASVKQAADAIGGIVDMYDQWTEARSSLAGDTSSGATQQRRIYDSDFTSFAQSYLSVHPEAAPFYQRVIVPEIAQSDSTLGKTLEASNL